MFRGRLLPIIIIGVVCFAGAALAVHYLVPRSETTHAVHSSGRALIGGPFALVDQTGKPRTDKDFRGRLMMVFFGFTYCPDVCPTTLHKATEMLKKLGDDADKVRVVFISIDPERDTPAQLARYHEAFDPRIVMLTGSPDKIAAVAKEYRVYYAKRKLGDDPGDYTMDHSSFIYLMDRDGGYLAHFAHNITTDKLLAAVRKNL